MKLHKVRLSDGRTVEVNADDVRFMGGKVYKIVGTKWTELFRIEQVHGIYVKS